jgi:hypothetical protein
MPHLIKDVAEGVWKNSLILKVIGPEREEDEGLRPGGREESTGLFEQGCPHPHHPDPAEQLRGIKKK